MCALTGDRNKHDLLLDVVWHYLQVCRARRESGALIHLLGSPNCARVTHFTSAFHSMSVDS